MLSNKLKIKELVGSYWAEPLFFYIGKYGQNHRWLRSDCMGGHWYFCQTNEIDGQGGYDYWGMILPQEGGFQIGSILSIENHSRFSNKGEYWNFWKDAIYDPEGRGELKPNAK